MSVEVFANQPTGTVTAGGSTTSDTSFTVTLLDTWPAAATSTNPKTYFHIVDVANTSEIMTVTVAAGGSSGSQTWTVTRGAEGSTATTHAANWTCQQVVTANTLSGFKQATTAATTPVTVANTLTETVVATYQPYAGEIVAGTSFEAIAYGTWGTGGTTRPVLTWALKWGGTGGTLLCSLATNTTAPVVAVTTVAAGSTFDVNGTVTFIDATHAHANLNWWYNNAASLATTASNAVTSSSTAGGVTVSGSGPLVLTAKWGTAATFDTLTAVAPLIYRAA